MPPPVPPFLRRYTADFAAVAPRRTLVSEAWLVKEFGVIGRRLRGRLDPAVARAAVARDLSEQLQLMTLGGGGRLALQPLPGRQSGAAEWRQARGEAGVCGRMHAYTAWQLDVNLIDHGAGAAWLVSAQLHAPAVPCFSVCAILAASWAV
jgi:hypothetical protein